MAGKKQTSAYQRQQEQTTADVQVDTGNSPPETYPGYLDVQTRERGGGADELSFYLLVLTNT